jgi:ABC-2 type transport system permease protein
VNATLRVQSVAFATILRREAMRILRIWPQTLFPSAITMTLYFVIFGSIIGRRVGLMDGVPYMAYIAPGLIMMSVITNSYSNVVSSFFGAKFSRYVEELLVAPVADVIVLLGYMCGGMIRGLTTGLIVTGVALFFAHLEIRHPWIMLSTVLLTSATFSLAGFLNALFARKFDDISIIPTFVLTPLTYLGGVFYSIRVLPPFWRALSRYNPILYMVNAFREGTLGVSDIGMMRAYAMMGLFLVLFFTAAYVVLHRARGLKS